MLRVRRNTVTSAEKISMPSLKYLFLIVHAPITLAIAKVKAPEVINMRAKNVNTLALPDTSAVLARFTSR